MINFSLLLFTVAAGMPLYRYNISSNSSSCRLGNNDDYCYKTTTTTTIMLPTTDIPSPLSETITATTIIYSSSNNNNITRSANYNIPYTISMAEKTIGKEERDVQLLPKNANETKNCTCEYMSKDFNNTNSTFTVCHFPFDDNASTKPCLNVEDAMGMYSNQSKKKLHTEYFIIFCLFFIILLNIFILFKVKKKGEDGSNSRLFPLQFHKLSAARPVYKINDTSRTTKNSLPSVSINPNSLIKEAKNESIEL